VKPALLTAACLTLASMLPSAGTGVLMAQDHLELRWEGVTPGAVTLPAWGVEHDGTWLVALATEDRLVRLYGPDGVVVASATTAVRRPAGRLTESPSRWLVLPSPGTGSPVVRLDASGGGVRGVGTNVSVDRLILPGARFVEIDGQGLVYSITASGSIGQASTVGGLLWQRPLPSPPVTALEQDGAVIVAVTDGRFLRFAADGTGDVAFRWPRAPVAVFSASDGRGGLFVLDDAGLLSRVAADGTVIWSVESGYDGDRGPAPIVSAAAGTGETRAVIPIADGGVAAFDDRGRRRWTLRVPGTPIVSVAASERGRLLVLDGDNRLLVVDDDGSVRATLQLGRPPAAVSWVAGAGLAIVTYADWTIQAFALVGTGDDGGEGDSPMRRSGSTGAPHSGGTGGALRARADAVLAGASRSDRTALVETLVSQRHRAVLYDRVGEARAILGDLLQEAYREPAVRGGRVVNDFPEIRRAAAAELGQYMDRSSRHLLAQAVRLDPDPAVAAVALRAFARYGVDDAGALAAAVGRFRGAADVERRTLAPSIIAVVEDTSIRWTNPEVAQAAVELLARADLSREVRARAAEALR